MRKQTEGNSSWPLWLSPSSSPVPVEPPGVVAVVPGERIAAELAVRLKEAGFDRLVVLK